MSYYRNPGKVGDPCNPCASPVSLIELYQLIIHRSVSSDSIGGCLFTLFCNSSSLTCQSRKGHAASCADRFCSDDIHCISRVCVGSQCRGMYTCRRTQINYALKKGSLVFSATGLLVGAAAVDPRQCISGQVANGTCSGSDYSTVQCCAYTRN